MTNMTMEFFDWTMLGTFAGAVMAVCILTQITKGIKFVEMIPTQLWSYALSLIVLILAQVFGSGISAQSAVLAVFNAAVVSLAANGGYEALNRATYGKVVEYIEQEEEETSEE